MEKGRWEGGGEVEIFREGKGKGGLWDGEVWTLRNWGENYGLPIA